MSCPAVAEKLTGTFKEQGILNPMTDLGEPVTRPDYSKMHQRSLANIHLQSAEQRHRGTMGF